MGQYQVFSQLKCYKNGHFTVKPGSRFDTLEDAKQALNNLGNIGQRIIVDYGEKRADGTYRDEGRIVHFDN